MSKKTPVKVSEIRIIKELLLKKMSTYEIAKIVGRTRSSVVSIKRRYIKDVIRHTLTDFEKIYIIETHKKLSNTKMAIALNRDRYTISRYKKKLGIND